MEQRKGKGTGKGTQFVLGRIRVVTEAVAVADRAVWAVNHNFDALALRLLACLFVGLLLRVRDRRNGTAINGQLAVEIAFSITGPLRLPSGISGLWLLDSIVTADLRGLPLAATFAGALRAKTGGT